MAEVASVFQTKRVGVEATPGTLVQATKLFQSIGFTVQVKPEIEEFRPDGSKAAGLTVYVRDMTDIKVSGKPTYDEITYLLSMLFGDPTPTNPTAGAYVRTYSMNNYGADPFKTLTLDMGANNFWYRAGYMFLKDFNFKVTNKGVEIDGSGMAQTLDMTPVASSSSATYTFTVTATGGTFTITKGANTTAAQTFNVSAASLQTALEGLASIGTGNVTVSKTGNVYTIGFINLLADQAVTITVGTGSLTGGTGTLAAVQTGTALTTLPLKPIMLTHFDIYLEDTYAALTGATPLARGFNCEFNLSNKADVVKPIRSTVTSFDGVVETAPTIECKLTLAADNIGRSMLTTMRGNGTKYLRLKAVGNTISGAEKYGLTIDACLNVKDLSGPEDSEGIYALNWTFSVINDSTNLPGGFKITLENTVATL